MNPPLGFIAGFLVNRVGVHNGGACGATLEAKPHPTAGG